jgi:hypothetical protein
MMHTAREIHRAWYRRRTAGRDSSVEVGIRLLRLMPSAEEQAITAAELARSLGWGQRMVASWLRALVDVGAVERFGNEPVAVYRRMPRRWRPLKDDQGRARANEFVIIANTRHLFDLARLHADPRPYTRYRRLRSALRRQAAQRKRRRAEQASAQLRLI